MTTRLHRLWQPGNPQTRVFLPNFWMKVIEYNTKVPPNVVKFQVPLQMTKADVVEYLTKIYNLPVREVRMEILMGKLLRNPSVSERNHPRFAAQHFQVFDKEDDAKYAHVVFRKDVHFEFPHLFPKEKSVMEKLEQMVKERDEKSKKKMKEKDAFVEPTYQPGISKWFS